MPFRLHPDLELDSVRWKEGPTVGWARGDDRSEVWLDLSAMAPEGGELTFHYHGDVMDQVRNLWVEMKTFTRWFPSYAFDRPVAYRLIFDVPDDYSVATVGVPVEDTA